MNAGNTLNTCEWNAATHRERVNNGLKNYFLVGHNAQANS